MFTSYAQNFEDVMLWRALKHVENGFYIDIGAQEPLIDSVSLAFYEHGWRGVHVEPVARFVEKLRLGRPDETVIQAAVGAEAALIKFFEVVDTGLSTGDCGIAQRHSSKGFAVREIETPCIALSVILDRYSDRDIHWLKIDVEGMEKSVVGSWLPSLVRPWVVVLESTIPLTQTESFKSWDPDLKALGYKFVYFDGLNRFYVSERHPELEAAFLTPPNVFDDAALSGTASAPFAALLNQKIGAASSEIHRLEEACADCQRGIGAIHTGFQLERQDMRARIEEAGQQVQSLSAELERQQREAHDLAERLISRERMIGEMQARVLQAQEESQRLLRAAQQREQMLSADLTHERGESRRWLEALASRERLIGEVQAERLHLTQAQQELHTEIGRLRARQDQLIGERDAAKIGLAVILQHPTWLGFGFLGSKKVRTRNIHAAMELVNENVSASKESKAQSIMLNDLTMREYVPAFSSLAASRSVAVGRRLIELLDLDGSVFIAAAYNAILGREPDERGREHYLRGLKDTGSKIQVLDDLCRSAEGKKIGANSAGLLLLCRLQRCSRLPLIGWLLKVVLWFIAYPASLWIKLGFPDAGPSLDDLLLHHDEQFVHEAYQALLGRDPDSTGRDYYLLRLRAGASKLKIVKQLRRSREGRRRSVSLHGLEAAIRNYQRGQWPLLGWLFRLYTGVEGEGPTERRLRSIENLVVRFGDDSGRRLGQLERTLNGLGQLAKSRALSEVQSGAGKDAQRELADASSFTRIQQSSESPRLMQAPQTTREIYYQLKTAIADRARGAV